MLQVSEGLLYLGRLCDPISNSDSVPLRAERWWQRAPHEGGDSRGLSAEGGPGPGRQPRQRQTWQAEGRVHEDPGSAAGKPRHWGAGPWPTQTPLPTSPPAPGSAVRSSWMLAVSCRYSCDHPPAAIQGGPPGQDYPTGPSNHFLLPLSSTGAQDVVENIARSLITPLAEGPSLRAREGHLPCCSWTRRSEQTPMPGPF